MASGLWGMVSGVWEVASRVYIKILLILQINLPKEE